ncbi:MAG TPA: hypothetical protein DHW55_04295 [Flavobacteriales bacterium]|nr:hypothetical protein [Flavobacteriales bacterium]
MTVRRVMALCLCLGITFNTANAQCEPEEPRSSKAQKLFDKALHPKGKTTLEDRLTCLETALELEPEDVPMRMEAAELAFQATSRNPDMWGELTQHLDALEEICPGGMPEALYLRGAMAYMNDDYELALTQFQAYLSLPEDMTKRRRRSDVEGTLPELVFLNQFHMHAGGPEPSPIPEVSWDEDEYLPMLSPDGTLLFFTRTSKTKAKGDITTTRKELFTWAKRPDERLPFDSGVPLPEPFNLGTNHGGASISVDNKLMVLAANRPVPSNPANVDLFSTEYHVDYRDLDGSAVYTWSPLVPLGANVNSPQGWEAQPSISSDGETLFFAAARTESTRDKDGNLTMDIFTSARLDNGTWGPAEQLPAPVNSQAQDKSPFLHPDGRTLYFSSNRLPSGGGYDLWMSQRDATGTWGDPVNLGRPLNSSGDEHGLVVSTDGELGIFASRRRGTRGLDLCTYPLPADLKPDQVTVVKGDLGWPMPEGALTVSIEYVQSKRVEEVTYSKEDGQFAHIVQLEDGEDVVLTVQGENVGYHSVVVHEQGTEASSAIALDLASASETGGGSENASRAKGNPFELQDVQFETKKSTLSKRSEIILRALANHLERQPELRLDIDGHTDNIGEAQDNLVLSQSRAEVVKAFLVTCGVDGDRMTTQGHGESQPKTTNTTPEGRRVNRRTEFRWVD